MDRKFIIKEMNPYRFERKIFVNNTNRISIENMIKLHPCFFSEIFQERHVNNIYFDSLEFNNFNDNIQGNMFRTKYRIRWYGDLYSIVEKPVLEVKIKKGQMGTKKHYDLNPFKFKKGIDMKNIKDIIESSNIDQDIKLILKDQLPVTVNRYKRKYYQSKDKKFRITVDDEQLFMKINVLNNTFLQKIKDDSNIILELKYDKKYDDEADRIINQFPFRITKSSKYARVVELLY